MGFFFQISNGSERFSTIVGRFGSEFGSVWTPENSRFDSENMENVVLNFGKLNYKYKLELTR